MATETTNANPKSSPEPRTARRAIIAAARRVNVRDGAEKFSLGNVAAEAGLSAETVSAHFQNKQELLLAIAAEDLTSLAGAMRETPEAPQPAADSQNPSLRDETARLIRKKVMPSALDQVMKEVAPEPDNTAGGTIARLERRVFVLERAFADIVERHEKSLRDRQSALTASEENVIALKVKLDAAQESHAQTAAELHAAMNDARSRLNALELGHEFFAVKPESAAHASSLPGSLPKPMHDTPLNEMPLFAQAGDSISAVSEAGEAEKTPEAAADSAEAPAKESKEEATYLSAARRAAIEAHLTEAADLRGAQKPARGKGRMKFLLFGCAVPLVILAVSLMVLNRHTVIAEPVQTHAVQIVSQAALLPQAPLPQVVVTPPADPAPEQGANTQPLDALLPLAQGGDVTAMRDVGLKYLAGDGVAADEPQAARWLMQAAYKGEPTAEFWLGTLYARGRGVPVDAGQAVHWYEAAARQGNRRAMESLAVANFQGLGMEKNPAEAMKWFTKAAELGLRDAQFNLAVMEERGTDTPRSLADAYKWYAVAAANGDAEAQNRLAIVAGQMKPADLALAQHAAAGFKPDPVDQHANLAGGPKELPGG